MEKSHYIAAAALTSMAVGAFIVSINTNLTDILGGTIFGLGFATMSVLALNKMGVL